MTAVKICGIKTPEALTASCEAGARFLGFVFYEPSPRNISFDTAWTLARMTPTGTRNVGLFVDPTDEHLDHITGGIQLDMIQLHGNETPQRVHDIKTRTKIPIIKAITIANKTDLDHTESYEPVADFLLFDHKSTTQKGGTGQSFDWTLLQNKTFNIPWMLSGGLNTGNIHTALSLLKPDAVDVSSGVEETKGIKSPQKIIDFIQAVKSVI